MTPEDQHQDDRMVAIEKDIHEIKEILKPIAETYTTVSKVGSWVMGIAVFVSILIGVFLGAMQVLKK